MKSIISGIRSTVLAALPILALSLSTGELHAAPTKATTPSPPYRNSGMFTPSGVQPYSFTEKRYPLPHITPILPNKPGSASEPPVSPPVPPANVKTKIVGYWEAAGTDQQGIQTTNFYSFDNNGQVEFTETKNGTQTLFFTGTWTNEGNSIRIVSGSLGTMMISATFPTATEMLLKAEGKEDGCLYQLK